MEIHPRYDGAPAIDVVCSVDAIRIPFLRQRRRLVDRVGRLTDGQIGAPSRCAAWSVGDVVNHLSGTDRFWAASIAGGARGAPTRHLDGFDPEATPAAMVAADRGLDPSEIRARFAAATSALCDLVEALDEAQWQLTAEAPPGHLSVSTTVHHALWDSWIHERDVLLPLGLDVDVEEDEVVACLSYVAAISPAFAVAADPTRQGTLLVDVSDPDRLLVVDIGPTVTVAEDPDSARPEAVVLTGSAVEVTEALSQRGPLNHGIAEDRVWMIDGLAEVFRAATR